MPEYLSPGVYVEEIDTGNKPIEGVATSTAGFVGVAERGPTEPTLVTSFSEYTRTFGRYVPNFYLARGVEGFFQNGGKRCFVARIVPRGTAGPPAVAGATIGRASSQGNIIGFEALGHGSWPNGRLAFKISKGSLDDPSVATIQTHFRLTLMYWAPPGPLPTAPLPDPTDPLNATNPARRDPTIVESFDNLTADSARNTFYVRQVNGASVLVRLSANTAGQLPTRQPAAPANPNTPLNVEAAQFFPSAGANAGNDGGGLVLADFVGAQSVPPAAPGSPKTAGYGLRGLEEVDEIAILVCPDEHSAGFSVTNELINQCELLKDRFAILQSTSGVPNLTTFRPTVTSKYGAFYFPWIRITDPVTSLPLEIPPGGHIAGIYARSDIERGVHKAPANEVIRGLYLDPADPSSGLQLQISKAQQDILNPRNINVLRFFPGRGNLVWGARTTSSDPDWKYVNVRRLFIFVEESIEEATQWVVFEPNDEPLWARVRRSVGDFLTRLWMDGMLQGRTKEEAYFVRCDRTTMTQADIDNGRLIMLIGIAPVKPAEFVIFRIGQWTGGSEVAEA